MTIDILTLFTPWFLYPLQLSYACFIRKKLYIYSNGTRNKTVIKTKEMEIMVKTIQRKHRFFSWSRSMLISKYEYE